MLKWRNMQEGQTAGQTAKKKVCLAITKGNWGGAQRYVYDLAAALPKEKFDVFVMCGQGDTLPKKLSEINIRVFILSSLKRDIGFVSEIKNFFDLLHIIRKEKPDVLHLNSTKMTVLGAMAGRIAGTKKIIQTVHGFAFNEDRNMASKAVIRFFSWITILLSHRTIVIAEREKAQARRMPFVKNKIILIHNGIEKINFKEKEIARKELSKEAAIDTLWLGTIAELHKNKGLEYAIEALSKITVPFVFHVISEGEERENLQKLISELKLRNKVFLAGFLYNANQYLSAFDIFLLTSIKEGLPYTILEAGLAGLPVIASNVGGIPDIIQNNQDGILVTPARTGEIARAVEYMIQNPEKREEFGKNLREKVEHQFSLENMLVQTLKLY